MITTMDSISDKLMISAVRYEDGKVIWQTEASFIKTVLLPVEYRNYRIESLLRGDIAHIRMVGRHKQNSQEVKVKLDELIRYRDNYSVYMNSFLFPLAEKLKEEDDVFDVFTGKGK